MTMYPIFVILLAHYFADFILQNDYMANNKSKKLKPLLLHIGVYTSTIFLVTFVMLVRTVQDKVDFWQLLVVWAVLNGVLHFFTDYVTSRVSSYYKNKQQYDMFFNVIGFDQFLHYICLFGTYLALINV